MLGAVLSRGGCAHPPRTHFITDSRGCIDTPGLRIASPSTMAVAIPREQEIRDNAKLSTSTHPGILQWNCRGLANKIGELKFRVQYGKLRIWALLLQEHNALHPLPGFLGYHFPTIPDGRKNATDAHPGKAAVYVSTQYPHTQIDINAWCNTNQEVVAVHVRLPRGTVILVSIYIRPAPSVHIRLGWFAHLRRAYPGTPILVGGDFNAPHME